MSYRIRLIWDNESAVWIATSKDVPGLILESGSFDALLERVRNAVPELIELNDEKKTKLLETAGTIDIDEDAVLHLCEVSVI